MFKPSYIRKRSVIVDRECIQKVQLYYTFTYHVYTSLLSLLFPTPLIDGVAIFSQIFLSLFEPFYTSCAQNYNRKFITQCKKRIGYERHWDSRLITPCKKRTGYERHWNYLNIFSIVLYQKVKGQQNLRIYYHVDICISNIVVSFTIPKIKINQKF